MRLIDADKFIKDLKKKYPRGFNGLGIEINTFTDKVEEELMKQPTAYDVNTVIEKMSVIEDMADYQTYIKAVEIVKKDA